MDKKALQKMGEVFFKFFDPNAKVAAEDKDGLRLKVDTEASAILIGRFGETLGSIQYLLRLMAAKAAGEYFLLSVDIAGYKEKRETEIKELALQVAENVKNSGYAQELRPMNAYERRLVHVALTDFKGIKADSVGEGETRRVRIEAEG